MKKVFTFMIALLIVVMTFVQNAKAFTPPTSVAVTANAGTPGPTGYNTLREAFFAINAGTHQGAINIKINGSTTETASALLNASGTGSASYSSVLIYPTASGLSITGSISSSLIFLNGADHVTIDGRVNQAGETDLTITNTYIGINTSAILFINAAENNIIQYCTVKAQASGSGRGIITFSTTSSGNGNSGNKIDHCNITQDAKNSYNGIFSNGSPGYENKNDTISNCNIYNIFNTNATSSGIYLYSNTSDWNIKANHFYETTEVVPSGEYEYYFIKVNNTTGNNFSISDNVMGGNASDNSGMLTVNAASSHLLNGIFLHVGTTTASSVQNNTIKNINYTSTNSTPFNGIFISLGKVDIGTVTGNTIGSPTGCGSITITNTSVSSNSYGIFCGNSTVVTNNNKIGSITTVGSSIFSHSFYGIGKFGSGACTISSNTIGSSTTANSINAISNSSYPYTQIVDGIICTGTDVNTISSNTIANLNNATTSSEGGVHGIYYRGSTTASTINGNFIHGLFATNSSPTIYGISYDDGNATFSNNIISLGSGLTPGNPISGFRINNVGINATLNLYYNTVYIGGTASGTTSNTFALSNAGVFTRVYKNNIFNNSRSGGTTGNHYAVSVKSATNLTMDYNNYYVLPSGVLGVFNGTNKPVLSDWAASSGGDTHSKNANPIFANAGGTLAANYLPSQPTSVAVSGTGVLSDYDSITRSTTLPSMGAWEYAVAPTPPVKVIATLGTTTGDYTTLNRAFEKINDGTHQGAITIKINASTLETASAVLNANGSGSAVYSAVTIYPTVTGLSISGAIDGPLVDLNGADHVCIDGRVNGSGSAKDLTISNTSTSNIEGTSALRFIESAENNSIKYCKIKGSATEQYPTVCGIIYFASSSTGNGNDSDTIDNCDITSSTSGRANYAILSKGSSSRENSGIIISNNNIYNYSNPVYNSHGIFLFSNSSAWKITGNSFYETTFFVPAAGGSYGMIVINSGNNYEITNNFMGGSSANCNGIWEKSAAFSNHFYGIYLNTDELIASSIQGNTIKNINWLNNDSSPWFGFFIQSGSVNIGSISGNTIGSAVGTASIRVTQGGNLNGEVYGIFCQNLNIVIIQNNSIGSFTIGHSNTGYATNFYGISKRGPGYVLISKNIIGSTTEAESINATSISTLYAQNVSGVICESPGSNYIRENIIANLTNANTTIGGTVKGIDYSGSLTPSTINGNFIHSLSSSSSNTTIYGICHNGGTSTFTNNIISLGSDLTTGNSIIGFKVNAQGVYTINLYYNTIYIGGSVIGTTANTFALSNIGNNTRVYKNNIFSNSRTGGTTDTHYAVSVNSATNLTMDYNDYYAPSGVLGDFNSVDKTSLTDWATSTVGDTHSKNLNPDFASIGDTAANYLPSAPSLVAATGTGITTDYAGIVTRNTSYPSMGAWEYPVNACVSPSISGQSTLTQTQCLGGTFAPITVTATGDSLHYQWYSNAIADSIGGTTLGTANGANTSSYIPQASTSGTKYYYCLVTGSCGADTSAVSGAFNVSPAGDQTTYGVDSWIAYAYKWSGTPAFTTYIGYVTEDSIFDRDLDSGYIAGATTHLCETSNVHFSLRYKMTKNMPAGYYTFNLGADDGVRLSIDGGITWLIESWQDHEYRTFSNTVSVYLNGMTYFTLEYYENEGVGRISFNYTYSYNPPLITSQPSTSVQNICINSPTIELFVKASFVNSYQWYSNTNPVNSGGTIIPGATDSTYTPITSNLGTSYYYCVLTGYFGTDTSNVSGAFIINSIDGDETTYGTDSWIGYVYKWTGTPAFTTYIGYVTENSTFDRNMGYGNITGVTTDLCSVQSDNFSIRYKMNKNMPAGYYTFTVAADDGVRLSVDGGATWLIDEWHLQTYSPNNYGPVYLNASTNFILEYYENIGTSRISFSSCVTPSISVQPSTLVQNICLNGTASELSLTASNVIEYQWYQTGDTLNSGGTLIPEATTSTYTPLTTSFGTLYYYCVLTNTSSLCSISSNISGAVNVNLTTFIMSQSTNDQTTVINGSFTPISVIASGSNLTYQWYSSITEDNTGGISLDTANGAQTDTYTPQAGAISGKLYYYCVVSGDCGTIQTSYISGAFIVSPDFTIPTGSGTVSDPYLIANIENLTWLQQTKSVWHSSSYFLQTANINAGSTSAWYSGTGFPGIGDNGTSFNGHYNGGGFTIDSLFMNNMIILVPYTGMFPYIENADLQDIHLTNAVANSIVFAGILSGYAANSTIQFCSTTGNVITVFGGGGLLGIATNISVQNCYSNANIGGIALPSESIPIEMSDHLGGLIGNITGNTNSILNCYARGSVIGGSNIGGLIGGIDWGNSYLIGGSGIPNTSMGFTMENCYAANTLTALASGVVPGGLLGQSNYAGSHVNITNSYWDGQLSNVTNGFIGGTGKLTSEMKTQSTFTSWDFITPVWSVSSSYNDGYPNLDGEVNMPPTDILLSAASINENVAANSTVGTISSTDPDAGNTFTYTLVAGTGSTDNTSFNISGNSLRISNSPDYETKNTYSVRIRNTDQGGLYFEKKFTITINDLAEALVVTNANDAGPGSLRQVVANIGEGSFVTFNAALNGQTITLTTGSILINKNLTFDNSNLNAGITISGAGDNITINSGKKLSLATNSKLTVTGGIKNNAGVSGLQIASGASFIHKTIDLPATVQRELNTSWHLFGSPFKKNAGAVLGNITAAGGNTQMKPFVNGNNWGSNITSAIYPLLPTVGYAIKPNLPFTAALSGNLYYSSMVFDYTNSLVYNGTSASQSWNLVANPYTSYLDWNLLGKTNVNVTLYLWDNTLYPNLTPVANASYLRVFNPSINIGVPAGTSRFIAPLQGFFVKAVYTNPKLTFPPAARTHASAAYYKDASNTAILVRLKAATEAGTDELVICKNQDAKSDFELFDSEKMFSELPLQIYSQSSTGEQLIINSINTADNNSIPLGIIGNTGAKARITAFALETTEQLYLEDRLKGKMISLSENTSYDFEFPTDVITGRFFIRFGNINTPLTSSDVKVFECDNLLNIIAQTGENIEQVEMFTITGARVYKSDAASNILAVKLDLTAGVYLVRVKTNIGVQNVKVNWK